jgi:hypothetical protein
MIVDEDTKSAVRALAHNPGFKYLCRRLETNRTALEQSLYTTQFPTLNEYYALQSKIMSLKWLEAEVQREIHQYDAAQKAATPPDFQFTPTESPGDVAAKLEAARGKLPYERETLAFARAQQFVELVGNKPAAGQPAT